MRIVLLWNLWFFLYLTLIEIVLELKYECKIGWIKYLGLKDFESLEYGMKRKLNKLLIPIF